MYAHASLGRLTSQSIKIYATRIVFNEIGLHNVHCPKSEDISLVKVSSGISYLLTRIFPDLTTTTNDWLI